MTIEEITNRYATAIGGIPISFKVIKRLCNDLSITLNIRRANQSQKSTERIDKLVADVLLISTETAAIARSINRLFEVSAELAKSLAVLRDDMMWLCDQLGADYSGRKPS